MNQHFNGLDPEIAEMLAIMSEECGEVVQQVSKILRHGINSINPYNGVDNRAALENELTDIFAIVEMLHFLKVINKERVVRNVAGKMERLGRPGILHHSRSLKPQPCAICGSVERLQVSVPAYLGPVCLDQVSCREMSSKAK